jgi:hypothetical protein
MSSPATTIRSAPPRQWQTRAILAVVGMIAMVAAIGMATLWFGLITGEEFCPFTFTRRTFFYYEVPLIGAQVSPITRDVNTNALATFLKSNNYIVIPANATHRWDLVFDMRSSVETSRGDAAILCAYLDAVESDGTPYWEKWTEKHPAVAKILWPEVASIAQAQLYILIPDLIELAKRAASPAQFRKDLDVLLAKRLSELARVHRHVEDDRTAVDLLNQALRYLPNDSELLRAREEAQAALGEAPAAKPATGATSSLPPATTSPATAKPQTAAP